MRVALRLPWLVIGGLSLAVPGAKGADDSTPSTLTPYGRRITDEAVAADLATFSGWQARLDALRATHSARFLYHRAKAQAWLSFARDEYAKNDRSGATETAMEQAIRLIAGLESGDTNLSLGTPPLYRVDHVGGRRWELASQLVHGPSFPCVAAEVGKLEVELLRAAHEQQENNPCRADAHLRAADVMTSYLQTRAEECLPKPTLPVAIVPLTPAERRQIELLPKFVHFALDSASIIPQSATVLDTIARVLVAIPQVRLRLEGHADKRASVKYNLALSKRRANAVQSYLSRRGVALERMEIFYHGKSRPRVAGESVQAFARNRCVIFTYLPPRDVTIKEVPQESDLQIESGKKRSRSRR